MIIRSSCSARVKHSLLISALRSTSHRTAAPASTSTASPNHASLVPAPTFPALPVAVAEAVPVLDAPPAIVLAGPSVGVVEVSIVLDPEMTVGSEVVDTGPGPPRAERLLLAFADSADAGNVASGDAVSGMLNI